MSEAAPASNKNAPKPKILIFRGITKTHERDRAGAWWSTDPYYALFHAGGGAGSLFVASVDEETLAKLSKDASIDEDYENYLFPKQDPPGIRTASTEEIEALRGARPTQPEDENPLSVGMVMHPNNAVEIGQRIFGDGDLGSLAVSEAVTVITETK